MTIYWTKDQFMILKISIKAIIDNDKNTKMLVVIPTQK